MTLTYTVDYRKGILGPIFNFIKNWVTRFVNDIEECKKFYSSMNTFISTPFIEDDINIFNGCYNWLHLRSVKNMEILGYLGLRLQSTGCSEAACERVISAQRMLLTSKRLRSTMQLIDSRLKLMRG